MEKAESLGREAEMLHERPLELPAVAEVEKQWNALRANSEAFAGQRDRWAFCASEVLYPDSLFFLGLNPSEPKGHHHTRFGLKELTEYDGIFNPLRKLAKQLDWAYSYFDLFCFRRTTAGGLHKILQPLLTTEEGRHAVAAMIELAGQAIKTASPKVIYVCNGTAKDTLQGKKILAKLLREAGLSSAFFFAGPPPCEVPFCRGADKRKFYYTVTHMCGRPIPVLLGMDLKNTRGLTNQGRDEIIDFLAKTFEAALPDPEGFYRRRAEAR